MAISRNRFPSSPESLRVFTFISVPVHIWAWIAILRVVPSWILSMSAVEMAGVLAYPLAFAVVESLLIFLGLWILAVVLPYSFYRARFISQSILILLTVLLWGIILQVWGESLRLRTGEILIEFLIVVIVAVLLSVLLARSTRIQKALTSFADRLLVMGIFYSLIGAVCLLVVLFNNLF